MIELTTQRAPKAATQWSTRTMAKEMGDTGNRAIFSNAGLPTVLHP